MNFKNHKPSVYLLLSLFLFSSCDSDERMTIDEPTKTIPTISNSKMSHNRQTYNFSISADIVDNGNSEIISKGVCYDTRSNPTLPVSRKIESTFKGDHFSTLLSYGGGISKNDPTTLELNRTYYARPYATNEIGTAYGDELILNTNYSLRIGGAYKGGVIIYFLKPTDIGYDENIKHGLLIPFVSEMPKQQYSWGCKGTSIVTSTAIGMGRSNTETIANNCHDSDCAAKFCDNWESNGFSDWYLPSRYELEEYRKIRTTLTNRTIPNIGYFTSNQADADYAFRLNSYGGFDFISKESPIPVIPFKSF